MVACIVKQFARAEFEPEEEMCCIVHHKNFHLHMLTMKYNNSH